ncbi:hypothetical protein HPB47_026806 [Ixodes persulcatus]|uniref:Uncharacterized protein n=1 Tax=Ixodes persulcatus TaxID=34615 RepID=A0AC60Q022_IXOPE|nr:hypothetical protein HPB47_026806 [Ixodes persulcatus]
MQDRVSQYKCAKCVKRKNNDDDEVPTPRFSTTESTVDAATDADDVPCAAGSSTSKKDIQTFRTVLILALATCAFAGYLGYGGYAAAPLAHSSVAHHTPYFSYGYGQQSVGHGYGLGYGLGYGHGLIGHRYGGFY